MLTKPQQSNAFSSLLPFAVLLLLLLAFLFLFNFRLFITSGPSMEPTYTDGDTILAVRLMGTPKKGEIVLLKYNGFHCAKRVAFLPGEDVSVYNLDGYWGSSIVPDGYVYVLGDNPDHSLDSRDPEFGLVSISDIWGTPVYSPPAPDIS